MSAHTPASASTDHVSLGFAALRKGDCAHICAIPQHGRGRAPPGPHVRPLPAQDAPYSTSHTTQATSDDDDVSSDEDEFYDRSRQLKGKHTKKLAVRDGFAVLCTGTACLLHCGDRRPCTIFIRGDANEASHTGAHGTSRPAPCGVPCALARLRVVPGSAARSADGWSCAEAEGRTAGRRERGNSKAQARRGLPARPPARPHPPPLLHAPA